MRVEVLAARDQVARQRIEQYAAELTEQQGLDPVLAEQFDVSRIRDKSVAAMMHREATANFLAALLSDEDEIAVAVGDAAAEALVAAGYDTPEAIRNASDEDLDAVDGVGPATISKLREAFGEGGA